MIQKTLFTYPIFESLFNRAYEPNQSINDAFKYGSKTNFSTDHHINGEYFRSRTDNQYFCVVEKEVNVGELSQFIGDFRPIDDALKIRTYNSDKHIILRLEFMKHKAYFLESYQAISIKNPDVTVMDMPLEELLMITPKFEPLSDR